MSLEENPPADDRPSIRELTRARVGLGRAGGSIPTAALLAFRADHAQARDAVHRSFDGDRLVRMLEAAGHPSVAVRSAAASRRDYIARPELGRTLSVDGSLALALLRAASSDRFFDLAIVLCDGLSPRATELHGGALAAAIASSERLRDWSIGPMTVVTNGRVAIGDEIGAALGARMVVVVIGERPGLSAPESVGLYVTIDPAPGRTDAQRNCISNIHAHGLSYEEATRALVQLVVRARIEGATGVRLEGQEPMAVEP